MRGFIGLGWCVGQLGPVFDGAWRGIRSRVSLTHVCICIHTRNVYPTQPFELRENDYVFGQLKFGGNAQSACIASWVYDRLVDR